MTFWNSKVPRQHKRDFCVPLFSFLIHILILYKVSTCSLFGGSNNRRWQRWLQERKTNYFVHRVAGRFPLAQLHLLYITFLISSSSASLSWRDSLLVRRSPPSLRKKASGHQRMFIQEGISSSMRKTQACLVIRTNTWVKISPVFQQPVSNILQKESIVDENQ